MASQVKTVAADAADKFSDPLFLPAGMCLGISISGAFTATVSVQRRHGADGQWRTVKTFEAEAEEDYGPGAPAEVRIGVDTGDYSDGEAVCTIWF